MRTGFERGQGLGGYNQILTKTYFSRKCLIIFNLDKESVTITERLLLTIFVWFSSRGKSGAYLPTPSLTDGELKFNPLGHGREVGAAARYEMIR